MFKRYIANSYYKKITKGVVSTLLSAGIVFSITAYPISATTTENVLNGDVNGNGVVTINDYVLLRKYIIGLSTTFPNTNMLKAADINSDGKISATDSTLLKKILLAGNTIEPYPNWSNQHSSYATYTGSGYSGGCAMLDPISSSMEITALNPTDYNAYGVNAALAGSYLEVKGSKGTTIVYVTDLYPEGGVGALDLCPTSFAKIGDVKAGKIDIQWHVVKAPITGNFSYSIKEGSSPSWAAIQVRNHKYPVLKMEYYQNGNWITMEKMLWNYFVGNNMGTGPIKIRITDIHGKVVNDTIQPLPKNGNLPSYIVSGAVQFPD